jgi:hypothetical protein
MQHAIRNEHDGDSVIENFETWLATQVQNIGDQICENLPEDFAFTFRKLGEIDLSVQKVSKSNERTLHFSALDA